MNTPTLTPDFYIGISTQNPPTIISIGQTINGMEEVEVRLDQPDEEKLNIFKGKIENIQTINYPRIDNVHNLQVNVPSQEAEAAKNAKKEEADEADKDLYGLAALPDFGGAGKKTKRRRNKRRLTKRRKTKRSKSNRIK